MPEELEIGRVFRLDRIGEVRPLENAYEVPESFAVAEFLSEGRVFYRRIDVTSRAVPPG